MKNNPKSLYRFRPVNSFLDPIILDCQLYFSLYKNLNDPSEGFYRCDFTKDPEAIRQWVIYMKKMINSQNGYYKPSKRVIDANKGKQDIDETIQMWENLNEDQLVKLGMEKKWTQEEKDSFIKSQKTLDFNYINVCCFCEDYKSPAMSWYYAKENTGVCLEFSRRDKLIGRATPVNYCKTLPLLKFYSDPISQNKVRTLYKSEHWKHEAEWRIINHQQVNSEFDCFSPTSLVSVGILPNMCIADREKVFNLVRQHNEKYERKLKIYDFELDNHEYGWVRNETSDSELFSQRYADNNTQNHLNIDGYSLGQFLFNFAIICIPICAVLYWILG